MTITYTKAAQPWSQRLGGGYPDKADLELAADMLECDVLVGPPHPIHGWFMTRNPAAPLVPREDRSKV
jgi:hypothetical protein